MEVRELLDPYDFPGDDTPIIVVHALKALKVKSRMVGHRRLELGRDAGLLHSRA